MLLMPSPDLKADFCIRIDFSRSSENPQRVFMAMTEMIQAFQDLDKKLASSVDSGIEPVMLLEDIEASSLSAWLSSQLKKIPDDAITDLDWKKIFTPYLVKAKYIIIKWLDGKTALTNEQIIDVQFEILEAAKETGISHLDSYAKVPTAGLVESINQINNALQKLNSEKDKAEFISKDGTAPFNLELKLAPGTLEELITKETIISENTQILKVKKPDYLGESMWEMHHVHVIHAKVLDFQWLTRFQNRDIDVRPGDSIRARVRTKVKYGYDYAVIDTHYEILEVIEVIQGGSTGAEQTKLPLGK